MVLIFPQMANIVPFIFPTLFLAKGMAPHTIYRRETNTNKFELKKKKAPIFDVLFMPIKSSD